MAGHYAGSVLVDNNLLRFQLVAQTIGRGHKDVRDIPHRTILRDWEKAGSSWPTASATAAAM